MKSPPEMVGVEIEEQEIVVGMEAPPIDLAVCAQPSARQRESHVAGDGSLTEIARRRRLGSASQRVGRIGVEAPPR